MKINLMGNIAIMRINDNTIDNVIKTSKIATDILYKSIDNKELNYILILTNDHIQYIAKYDKSDAAEYKDIEAIFKGSAHQNWRTLIKLDTIHKLDSPILVSQVSTKKIKHTQRISYLTDSDIKGLNKRLERYELVQINRC